jgi:glycosyltransferase involved in cell wall biosynthesis
MTRDKRPRRIDQVLPSIVGRDAVSHHTLEAQRVLRSLGFVSEIYAVTMGPEMAGRVHPIEELPREEPSSQWLCYQGSTGSPAAEVFSEHPGGKLLDYHNITPAEFVSAWMPALGEEVSLGRRQMAELAPLVDFALADSAYNKAELDAWGYRRSVVSMLMVDHANFDVAPDPVLAAQLAEDRSTGGADWLFVGQFLPHKSQHEVVEAFAAYRAAYDKSARLHLVGRPSSAGYAEAVRLQVRELGLEGAVDLAGSVSPNQLAALYRGCDLYVCCSEHEGFCAPLLEAMHHGLPVLAFDAGAVAETLGGAGLVLSSKEPALFAAAASRLQGDKELRNELLAAGEKRAQEFTPERARAAFAEAIEQALAELTG